MISKIRALFNLSKKEAPTELVNEGESFIGLIDEGGVTNTSYDDKCFMSFTLCAYIKDKNPVEIVETIVEKKIPNMDFKIEGLEPLTVVEFTGQQIDSNSRNKINLITVIKPKTHNSELEKIFKKRLKPVEFKSEVFGDFILNRIIDEFEIKAKWNDHQIQLSLSGSLIESSNLESTAIKLFNESKNWEEKIRSKIAIDLLPLKNEFWIDDDEKPLSESDFINELSLISITINSKNSFVFFFTCGYIFGDHSISICGNLSGELDEAEIY